MSSEPSEPVQYLLELSGEHPSLPAAEALACLRSEWPSFAPISQGPGYLLVSATSEAMDRVAPRLALTHGIGRVIGTMDDQSGLRVEDDAIGSGSVALRIKRFQDYGADLDLNDLTRKVGDIVTKGRKVDLNRPDIEIRVFVSDRTFCCVRTHLIERGQYDLRAVKERPFFSPISLHPRLARALVNLTGVKRGERLLDPFCGTGGILIEAALLGIKAIGSDLSPKMIEGCAENMEHFGLRAEALEVLDIGDIASKFGEVDGIATDPPYGRSTSTNREALDSLYIRSMAAFRSTLKVGGRLGVAYPREVATVDGLEHLETHVQRVHRSLDRRYSVYRRTR